MTLKETNHARPPLRGRFKLSPLLWSASPNKTMTWKNSCAKRMQTLILRWKTKKAPVPREGTKKGWKVATPQVDQNDKILAGHPSPIRFYLT